MVAVAHLDWKPAGRRDFRSPMVHGPEMNTLKKPLANSFQMFEICDAVATGERPSSNSDL